MNIKTNYICSAILLHLAAAVGAFAQGTAFTYQGRLNDGASVASGSYDLRFALFDATGGGAQQGNALTNAATAISNGLFTVTLDFGNQFPGAGRWLEIGVRTNGSGAFATLSPRQQLTSTPYAIQAGNAASAGSVAAANITGTIPLANLPTTVVTNGASGVNITGTFSGNAGGLSNLNSANLTGPLSISFGDPVNIGHTTNGLYALGVAVSGNYAYLANYDDGLRVYNITNPANPVNIGHTNNGGQAFGVAVSGNYAYLANGPDGLRVYAITNPANPVNIGYTNNVGYAEGVAVSGNYAYLANYTDGLRVYNISNPANPLNIGHTNDGAAAFGVAVSGNYAYLANDTDGLRVYDISNPANPVNIGHTNNVGNAYGVAVSGNYAYLANFSDGLRVYDISNPANPLNIGHANNGGAARGVTVSGNYAYLANFDDGLRVYDISNPANPLNIGHIDNGGLAWGVAVSGNYAYLANYDDGLRVYALGVVSADSFRGDGSGLTSLNASQLTTGTVSDTRLSPNVALRAGGNTFTGNQTNFGSIYMDNAQRIAAGNSFGVYEDFLWPRWSDDVTYLNYGANGFNIRDDFYDSIMFFTGSGDVGIGTMSPAAKLDVNGTVRATQFLGDGSALTGLDGWKISGNSGTTPGVNFLGTTDNQPLDFRANNQRVLRLETVSDGFDSYANVIGGSSANSIGTGSFGSVIGGGGSPFGRNTIWTNSPFSVIGGGQANNLGPTAGSSIIAGGQGNTITNGSYYGAILGGSFNRIGQGALYTTMGGGAANVAADFSYITVIGGGSSNLVSGNYATIPGGQLNSAGSYGFAAGRRAKANHQGSFVWADSVDADFASTAGNQFSVRASGGVRLITAGAGLQVDGSNVLAGTVPASVLTGTIADARLSANVALRTVGNTFSGNQIVTNGNVGIGTTSPGKLLQIGSITNTQDGMIRLSAGNGIATPNRTYTIGIPYGGADTTGTNFDFIIEDTSASAVRFVIDWNTGNVGIGKSSPATKLDVNGTVTATTFSGNGSTLTNLNASQLTSGTVADALLSSNVARRAGGNTFSGDQTNTGSIYMENKQGIWAKGTDGISKVFVWPRYSDDVTYLNYGAAGFSIRNNSDATTMFMQNNGNVGIGTLSPAVPLSFNTVLGDKISFFGSAGNHYGIGIQNFQLQIHSDNNLADIVFGYGQSTNLTETMRIKGNGNVGIGTTNPASRMTVATGASAYGLEHTDGTRRLATYFDNNGAWLRTLTPGKLSLAADSTGIPGITIMETNLNQFVGIMNFSPQYTLDVGGGLFAQQGYKPGGGSWTATSDARLKKNIHTIPGALDKLLALHGVNFEFIDPERIHELPGERTGLVAQEVEKVFPDWVETGKDGYKRVTVRGLEGLVPEALRQLREEEDAKIARIKTEKDVEIEALQKRIEKLERLLTRQAGGGTQ